MTATSIRIDPMTRYVRSLPGDWLMQREAADLLGISRDALKQLGYKHPDTLGPGFVTWLGDIKIYLYTDEDVEQVRAYLIEHPSTRRRNPPTWSTEEHASRHRRRALARYHRMAGDTFAAAGRDERAALSRQRAADITAGLAAEHRERMASLR